MPFIDHTIAIEPILIRNSENKGIKNINLPKSNAASV